LLKFCWVQSNLRGRFCPSISGLAQQFAEAMYYGTGEFAALKHYYIECCEYAAKNML